MLFDAAALAAEIAVLDESAWLSHPQGFAGNSALPLISANGDVDDDGFSEPMRPTPLLDQLPRLRGALAALGCVLGRSRLMRLSGNAEVKKHTNAPHACVPFTPFDKLRTGFDTSGRTELKLAHWRTARQWCDAPAHAAQ